MTTINSEFFLVENWTVGVLVLQNICTEFVYAAYLEREMHA
jgi:hypothetical protein